jgi:hypothetical protein
MIGTLTELSVQIALTALTRIGCQLQHVSRETTRTSVLCHSRPTSGQQSANDFIRTGGMTRDQSGKRELLVR